MEEKLEKALECCSRVNCCACPKLKDVNCMSNLYAEVKRYIDDLEERLAITQESMETLEKRCKELDALEQRCKALEKRNEPVSPICSQEIFGTFLVCGNCGEKLENVLEVESINGMPIKWKYCRKCGQAVKLE